MSRYKTLADVYRDAVQVQDACNIGGVTRSLVEVIDFLWTLPDCSGTTWVARHPAVQLFVDKIADLSGVRPGGQTDSFSAAYNTAKHYLAEAEKQTPLKEGE